MIRKKDIDNMSPEELEAFKREASMAIVKKLAWIFLLKVGTQVAIRQLVKRLS